MASHQCIDSKTIIIVSMDGIDSLDFSSNVFVDEVISFPATDGIPIRQMPRLMLDSSVILAVSQEAEQ